MAEHAIVPLAGEERPALPDTSQVRQWGKRRSLSSLAGDLEQFLASRLLERMPWLAVAMLLGIAAWFALPGPADWLTLLGACAFVAGCALIWRGGDEAPLLRIAIVSVAVVLAAGTVIIWARSTLVGAPPIGGPVVAMVDARIVSRVEQSGQDRTRLVVAMRNPDGDGAIRSRVTLPSRYDSPRLKEGTTVRMRVRLAPPQRALVPGSYDFARAAWFAGISATGSVLSAPVVLAAGQETDVSLGALRRHLARLVESRVASVSRDGGSAGAIAATLATGVRGAIRAADEQAMRDAGLAHLLSISGMHVGAVVALTWFMVMRCLALSEMLALKLRLPIVAGATAAVAGVAYTILTGAAVPTVRACLAAVLVLAALALGRQALSMRLIALAAMAVMLFWPEEAVGPSFQLSFAAVIAIVALHGTVAMTRMREGMSNGIGRRAFRVVAVLFLTGLAVEAALMPLVLLHFHRAGLFGVLANLIAIPLTTMAIMPLLGVALVLDGLGLGGPAWWLCGVLLDQLLSLAHFTASRPGGVLPLPVVAPGPFLVIAAGGLWFAIWSGRERALGLLAIGIGGCAMAVSHPPDLMIAGDGRNFALRNPVGGLYVLKTRRGFARDTLLEINGIDPDGGSSRPAEIMPGARCNADFCFLPLESGGETHMILASRRRAMVDHDALIAACSSVDVVIADWRLPAGCRPRLLMADSVLLSRRGGAAVDLNSGTVRFVREEGDRHGW